MPAVVAGGRIDLAFGSGEGDVVAGFISHMAQCSGTAPELGARSREYITAKRDGRDRMYSRVQKGPSKIRGTLSALVTYVYQGLHNCQKEQSAFLICPAR